MSQPPSLDPAAMAAARRRWATRAKPPGSLGMMEDVAVHLAGLAGRCPPPVPEHPAVVVFAGDHGVVEDGASAWPAAVTVAMVDTISRGAAAINAIATTVGAYVSVVDVGVAGRLPAGTNLIPRRVRAGTNSIARGPAMTRDEAAEAVAVGVERARAEIEAGADCLVGGEMGIGNTTSSAALIAAVTGADPAAVTGPGAGTPTGGLDAKRALVAAAVERFRASRGAAGHGTDPTAIELLSELGGLEIAALAGFYTEAAHQRVPFLVDGVIACAALCVADRLEPGVAGCALIGHRSTEPAAGVAIDALALRPLLDLDLRLGEGTGAALAVPILQASARALTTMADLPTGDGA
ncbi:MAG: nicotinate-nucleotide--dimethylbenzimidazole phosphoribosyltransferase [Acidimicrobiales bacterium]